MKASEVMTRSVVTVREDDSIRDVASEIVDCRVSGFPVVNDQHRVVGIITEGDLLRRLREVQMPVFMDILGGLVPLRSLSSVEEELAEVTGTQVRDLMSHPVVTVKEDADVREVANLLVSRNIKRVPVVDEDGRLVGIISRSDIVRSMIA